MSFSSVPACSVACSSPMQHLAVLFTADLHALFCRITTIRVRWAGVAVANKHTLAVTDGGAVYSWGDNSQGQLGYGTTDSAANGNPRVVEAMKVCCVSCARRHVCRLVASTHLTMKAALVPLLSELLAAAAG
jgi:Regulator of chromosome condensation (RCC1) repeat